MRKKGIQLSPKATPTRTQNMVASPHTDNRFEGQILYDERPDGSKMPILDMDGQTIRRGNVSAGGLAEIESNLRAVRSGEIDLKQMTGDRNG